MSCGAKTCSSPPTHHVFAALACERVTTWPVRIARAAHHALQRQRQRNDLLELDDWLLNDIGVTKDQAREEGRKPWWR
jgi:uncharacterized protein YjiS (DUF1127 family)